MGQQLPDFYGLAFFLEDNKVKVTQWQSDQWIDRNINATSGPKVNDWSVGEGVSIDLGW